MISSESIHIMTRSQRYDPPQEKKSDNTPVHETTTSIPPPTNDLQIEKPILHTVLWPPKSTIRKSIFNPSVCDSKYYKFIEYLD